ncbi:MAG: nucleotidyltransferase family protein [Oscillospiraceae bacterium]|nr:nucleotidyltransferase family protein [Oscillospiraceae bacterium]
MKTAAIIAEYNPFHNGHAYQINYLRGLGYDYIVIVMSGNFVQRGTAAFFPKEVRTKAALVCGADLVIELPLAFATASAESFAFGAVSILNALGCIDALCFGCECDDLSLLTQLSQIENNPQFISVLRKNLDSGLPYHTARSKTCARLLADSEKVVNQPNNILAIEYLKALQKLNSPIKALPLLRKGVEHDASHTAQDIASASYLRAQAAGDNKQILAAYVPKKADALYNQAFCTGAYLNPHSFEIAMLSRLRSLTLLQWGQVKNISEGLENAFYRAAQQACTLEELYTCVKTKRYPHARLRRLTLHAALEITCNSPLTIPYIHVLGSSAGGFNLLKSCKQNSCLPVSHSLRSLHGLNPICAQFAQAEYNATALYNLCLQSPRAAATDYTTKFIKIL